MDRRYRVLVVDDEPENLRLMERALRKGYEVSKANGGAEALEMLRKEPFDALLTDHRMPNMTGVELAEQATAVVPGIVRLLVTGYTDPADVLAAVNRGHIQRYITKPWEPAMLREELRQCLVRLQAQRNLLETTRELQEQNERLLDAFEALEDRTSPMVERIATIRRSVARNNEVSRLLVAGALEARRARVFNRPLTVAILRSEAKPQAKGGLRRAALEVSDGPGIVAFEHESEGMVLLFPRTETDSARARLEQLAPGRLFGVATLRPGESFGALVERARPVLEK